MSSTHRYALAPKTRLRDYVIGDLLGHGGFGLTYLARGVSLARDVAIKELLPTEFAIREQDAVTVVLRSRDQEPNFNWAKDRFLEEARTLAALEHELILPVHDFFEENGTAYMITKYIPGESFEKLLRREGVMGEAVMRKHLNDLLEALEIVHNQEFLHRDLKTENIIIHRDSGRPVLIDFGNARVSTGERTSNVTAVLTPGYAPLEQYSVRGRQGPWTDLYALGAVCYRAITGAPPEDSASRINDDNLVPLAKTGRPGFSREFLATIDKALQLKADDRWKNCREWREALGGGPVAMSSSRRVVPTKPVKPPAKPRVGAGTVFLGGGLALALAASSTVALIKYEDWQLPEWLKPTWLVPDPPVPDVQKSCPDFDEAMAKRDEGLPVEAIGYFLKSHSNGKFAEASKQLEKYLVELAYDFPKSLEKAVQTDSPRPYGGVLGELDKVVRTGVAIKEATDLKGMIDMRDQQVDNAMRDAQSQTESGKWPETIATHRKIHNSHPEYPAIQKSLREVLARLKSAMAALVEPAAIHSILAELKLADLEGLDVKASVLELQNRICELAEKETDSMESLDMLLALEGTSPGLTVVRGAADKIGDRISADYSRFLAYNPFRSPGAFVSSRKLDPSRIAKAADALESTSLRRTMADLEPANAEAWLAKASEANDPAAQTRYASMLQPWAAPGKDPAKARTLLEKAWTTKYPEAGIGLANMLINDFDGAGADPERALSILEEVLKTSPNHGDALFLRCRAWEQQGRAEGLIGLYEKSSLHRPGLLRITEFGELKTPKRFFDPFLRVGSIHLFGDLGKAKDQKLAMEWYFKGGLHGSTYAGVTAMEVFLKANDRITETDRLKWETLARAYAHLGEKEAEDLIMKVHDNALRAKDFRDDLKKLSMMEDKDLMTDFALRDGSERSGWYYLRALVALKDAADFENKNLPEEAQNAEKSAIDAMRMADDKNHPMAVRWREENNRK